MAKADAAFITGKPVRISKSLRGELEAAIQAHLTAVEKLTAVLDKADGDPNLEPYLAGYSGETADLEMEITDEPHDEDTDTEMACEDEGAEHDGREEMAWDDAG